MEATYLWARDGRMKRPHCGTSSKLHHALNQHGRACHQDRHQNRTKQGQQPQKVIVDEGMTLYYFYNYGHFAEAYNPPCIPEGYREVVNGEIGEGTVLEFPSAGPVTIGDLILGSGGSGYVHHATNMDGEPRREGREGYCHA